MVWGSFGRFPCHIYSSDDATCGDFGKVGKGIAKKLEKAMEFSMDFSIVSAFRLNKTPGSNRGK